MVGGEVELIQKFQSGKTEAFDEIMVLFQEKVISLAYYRTGRREDALDITQEAFVRLYKVLPRWKPKASLFTWLYRVITNLSIDRGRKLSRGEVMVDIEKAPNPPEKKRWDNPSATLLSKEAGGMIAEAVAALPPRQKSVFILRHYQDLPLKEIAKLEGCSLGAVKANLFQALKKLQKSLKEYYKI